MTLNHRENMYAHYRSLGFEPELAANKAGYSNSISKMVSINLEKNEEVQKALVSARERREKKIQIDSEWVLQKLVNAMDELSKGETIVIKNGKEIDYKQTVTPASVNALCSVARQICEMQGYGKKFEMENLTIEPRVSIDLGSDIEFKITKKSSLLEEKEDYIDVCPE